MLSELGDEDYETFFYTRARIAGRREQIRLEVSEAMQVEIDPRDMCMLSPNEQPDGQVGPAAGGGEGGSDDEPPAAQIKKNSNKKA